MNPMEKRDLFFRIKLEVKRCELMRRLPSSNEAAELRADYFGIFQRVLTVPLHAEEPTWEFENKIVCRFLVPELTWN